MDARPPPTHTLSVTSDRANVKDIVKALLHTIFFHRTFTALPPSTHEILDTTLPLLTTPASIPQTLETHLATLLRYLDTPAPTSPHAPAASASATLTLQFLEKRRPRRTGWFGGKGEEETVWESWVVEVKVRSVGRAEMERGLVGNVTAIMRLVGGEGAAAVPPITEAGVEGGVFPWVVGVKRGIGGG